MNYRSNFIVFHLKALIIEHHYALCTSGSGYWCPAMEGCLTPAMPFQFFPRSSQPSPSCSHSQSHRIDDKVTKPLRVLPPPHSECFQHSYGWPCTYPFVLNPFLFLSAMLQIQSSTHSPARYAVPMNYSAQTIKSWSVIQLIHDLLWRLHIAYVRT